MVASSALIVNINQVSVVASVDGEAFDKVSGDEFTVVCHGLFSRRRGLVLMVSRPGSRPAMALGSRVRSHLRRGLFLTTISPHSGLLDDRGWRSVAIVNMPNLDHFTSVVEVHSTAASN